MMTKFESCFKEEETSSGMLFLAKCTLKQWFEAKGPTYRQCCTEEATHVLRDHKEPSCTNIAVSRQL